MREAAKSEFTLSTSTEDEALALLAPLLIPSMAVAFSSRATTLAESGVQRKEILTLRALVLMLENPLLAEQS